MGAPPPEKKLLKSARRKVWDLLVWAQLMQERNTFRVVCFLVELWGEVGRGEVEFWVERSQDEENEPGPLGCFFPCSSLVEST